MISDKQQIVDFIKDLAWSWKVEINKNANTVMKFADALWQQQIYFCCGFDSSKWRCSDNDFTKKKYIPFDIDIRLTHYNLTWEVLSEEEMDAEIKTLLDKIDNTTEFSWYNYAINSWNGLHLYYTWDEITIDKETYSLWVEFLQWMLNEIIAPYECDEAVKNIWRIMRLPWTINPRKKIHWKNVLWDMWGYECRFIKYRPDEWNALVPMLPALADEQKKKTEEEKILREEAKKVKASQWTWDDINAVDVWELACIAWWVEIGSTKWNCTALKEQHKNMWAFVNRDYNVVFNTWSSLIREKNKKVFTPYDIVYYEITNKDTKKTLEYFKEHYHVEPKKSYKQPVEEEIEVPKLEYREDKWFLYPAKVFDDVFRCFMAWELVTVIAEPNSWKTTFALDTLNRNKTEKWRKGFYINLEFNIRNVWRQRRLARHWFDKLNLTDLSPLSPADRTAMDLFVDWELSKFDYVNEPTWMELTDLAHMLIEKAQEWYELAVIDTFWDIRWNSWSNSWSQQNKTMQLLQSIAQNTWMAIMVLHHMNKNWKFSWSQKIKDYSNVFIEVSTQIDWNMEVYTEYEMTKDKFLGNDKVVDCYYHNWAYDKF